MSLFPHPLKNALERATRPMAKKRGFTETRILTDWPEIVGEHLAAHSTPLKISFPRQQNTGGTLTLSTHPAYALEIQQLTPMLLERIATYMGYRAIDRITIEQAYRPLQSEPASIVSPATEAPPIKGEDPLASVLERLANIRASKR